MSNKREIAKIAREIKQIKEKLSRTAVRRSKKPTKKLTSVVQKNIQDWSRRSLNDKPYVFLGRSFGDKGSLQLRFSADYAVVNEKDSEKMAKSYSKRLNDALPEYNFDIELSDYRSVEGGPITGWDGGPVYDSDGFYVSRPYTADISFSVIVTPV